MSVWLWDGGTLTVLPFEGSLLVRSEECLTFSFNGIWRIVSIGAASLECVFAPLGIVPPYGGLQS